MEVCGRRLLPFCLRHRVALEAIDSPILSFSRPFGAADVINAVRILSTHDMDQARRPVSLLDGYHFHSMRLSPRRLKREASKLATYFLAQSLWPRFWEKETKSNSGGLPWHLSVVACLVRNGHSTQEAWTMPEAEAIWLHVAHSRAAGADVSVVSDREWEAMESYRKSEIAKSAGDRLSN